MSSPAFRFVVATTAGCEGRLDRLIADATGHGRRSVRQWLHAGRVRVDGHVASASDVARPGAEVVIEDIPYGAVPCDASELKVLVETKHFVAVAKPAGLHCERGKSPGSLADLLERRYGDLSRIGERPEEAGLVHRLDRDTSGVVIAALDSAEYRRLREAFGYGHTLKQYLALAKGRLEHPLELDWPLARRARHMALAGRHDDALPATTWLEPLDGGDDWSLVLATMRTGVMHQVRVHMASAGHALFGDSLYGGIPLVACRRSGQLLHAMRVQVGGEIDVSVGPPADFLEAYAGLRRRGR